jgi:uncharacterized Zn finger protein
MSRWNDWGWYPRPAPKRPPPKHGIKVKKIGATWWGQRWIEALEKLSWQYSNRLPRGRTYARAGRVHDLEVEPGKVTARVTGTNPTPYRVTLQIAALEAAAWDKAVAEMAKQAIFAAELLAGQMPKEIDQAFRATGGSLFPAQEKDLQTDCSCPDWANPCKHIAATHYVLGEAFDNDPFLLFELRGRGKDEVLGALRARRAGAEGASAPGAGAALARELIPTMSLAGVDPVGYERTKGPLPHLRFSLEPPASPAAVLRQLGAPPSWSLGETPGELLGPLYQAVGALARELALRPSEDAAEPAAAVPKRAMPASEPRAAGARRRAAPARARRSARGAEAPGTARAPRRPTR